MRQSDVGVSKPKIPLEIEYALGATEIQQPTETVLQAMVANGLAEEHSEVICSQNAEGRELRLVRSYQLTPNLLEKLP